MDVELREVSNFTITVNQTGMTFCINLSMLSDTLSPSEQMCILANQQESLVLFTFVVQCQQ